jgi:GntR family transcriptional regulator
MSSPQMPKYQAIYSLLRQRILDGEFAPGSKLPPQAELASAFGVTLMTLRQAVAALEADGLVWAARGKGTFVADRPVDISLGNLSSFAQQMQASGVAVATDLLGSELIPAGRRDAASVALETDGPVRCLTRRRSVAGEPISLQRSYLSADVGIDDGDAASLGDSLYGAIEAATGWTVSEALESITAVALSTPDAKILSARRAHPALLSIRTSINQFGAPFLYDEALLVGGRCTMAANRSADRLSIDYEVGDS